jgi:hypothetical protein
LVMGDVLGLLVGGACVCSKGRGWMLLNSFFLEMNSLDYVLSFFVKFFEIFTMPSLMTKDHGRSCRHTIRMRCGNDEKHRGLLSWSIEAS